MILLFALAVASAAVAPGECRVLALDVELHSAGDPALATQASKIVTTELERAQRFDVVAGEDLRRALKLEADRQEAGCDTSSCLQEIAGAMGAQLVVFGDITALGEDTVLTLNLFDTAAVRSIARVSGAVDRATVAPATARLVRQLVREYDGSRGELPVGAVPIVAGAGSALAGGALLLVGGWQLALLAEDEADHDRLVKDFERGGDTSLIDDAKDVRRTADEHAVNATLALSAGALVAIAGLAGVGYGLWSAVE